MRGRSHSPTPASQDSIWYPPPLCRGPGLAAALTLTWKIAKLSLGVVAGWGVATELASPGSHSWIVAILRGGRWRWVRRAFLRWWKSPSVRVYLCWGTPDNQLLAGLSHLFYHLLPI